MPGQTRARGRASGPVADLARPGGEDLSAGDAVVGAQAERVGEVAGGVKRRKVAATLRRAKGTE